MSFKNEQTLSHSLGSWAPRMRRHRPPPGPFGALGELLHFAIANLLPGSASRTGLSKASRFFSSLMISSLASGVAVDASVQSCLAIKLHKIMGEAGSRF